MKPFNRSDGDDDGRIMPRPGNVPSMTYYLLVFDRRRGQLVEMVREFSDATEAMRARLFRKRTLRSSGHQT